MQSHPAYIRTSLVQRTVRLLVAAVLYAVASPSQTILLDEFDTLSGWHTIVSDGAHLTLSSAPGKTGNALRMSFDLSAASGYVIAEKDFPLEMPEEYRFTFDLRADAPDNNFEFKLIDDRENVYWLKKLDVVYPKTWTRQHIRKNQISFAWGPSPGSALRRVRKIQFVVSTGSGGRGDLYIDNFRFQRIDPEAERRSRAEIAGKRRPNGATISSDGTLLRHWRSGPRLPDSLTIDFHRTNDPGALVIDWDSANYATSYDVLLSDDGRDWSPVYSVRRGNGGRDDVFIDNGEGRFARILIRATNAGRGCAIRRMEIKGPISLNDFFAMQAAAAPAGEYPRYFRNEQSYWTVVAVDGDASKSLMNEEGRIEVAKRGFSLEPFLYINGRLVTWNDVKRTAMLLDDYLPVPSVRWSHDDGWTLTTQALAAGKRDSSILLVCYTLASSSFDGNARLFVALRPFQVYPPWQKLNIEGGVSRIDSISFENGIADVNGMSVIPLMRPNGFGAAEFDRGSVTGYLRSGGLPSSSVVHDLFGHASGALAFDLPLHPGEKREVVIAVPLHRWKGNLLPGSSSANSLYDSILGKVSAGWKYRLNNVRLQLPAQAQDIANSFRTNLAMMLIERVGPALHPGARSYDRSWIRDGSLMCAALLGAGCPEEVRDFIDWYAPYQYPSGKIPCVVDARGADATPENDSHGEFIYAVRRYFAFTHDTVWLKHLYGRVVKTVEFIDSLRAERKTTRYRTGTPMEKACYGLLPESISHEGYSDHPRHSYWDDFWALRGLKDAVSIAGTLGDTRRETSWTADRDDFRKDLYASMRLAMENGKINFIPGCAELADFDPTSTTIGILPGGELGNIPEPELHNTFDQYYQYVVRRKSDTTIANYTPYEMRAIGSFIALNQKERAADALEYFMKDRRPSAWNTWAEVVWRDPLAPKMIGDMPHAWVGSDFIRSVLAMFAYERESDGSYVLCGGIPDSWLSDTAGVGVAGLPTPFGSLSFSVHRQFEGVTVDISGNFDVRSCRLMLHSPLSARIASASIDGQSSPIMPANELLITRLPAKVLLKY